MTRQKSINLQMVSGDKTNTLHINELQITQEFDCCLFFTFFFLRGQPPALSFAQASDLDEASEAEAKATVMSTSAAWIGNGFWPCKCLDFSVKNWEVYHIWIRMGYNGRYHDVSFDHRIEHGWKTPHESIQMSI